MAKRAFAMAAPTFWIGVLLVLTANMLLPLQDALAKMLGSKIPVTELLFVRSVTVVALALAIGRTNLLRRAVTSRLRGRMTFRSLVILLGWITFYIAIRDLPLAQATTIYFASPILVSLLAGPILGERIGLPQWGAVGIGFAGVCLASGTAGFDLSTAAALALLSTFCWAVALLMLRAMSEEEGALVQVLFANGVFVVATAPFLLVWPPSTDPETILWMLLVGLVGGVGQLALYDAAVRLPASVLATLEYSAILTSFVLGYLMFGEQPTAAVIGGAALVLASALAMVAIARRRARSDAPRATLSSENT